MILCIGEILVDMIGTYKNGAFTYERKAGGAPFNVACAAKQFGAKAGFVGNVGNDILGQFLVDFSKSKNLNKCLITKDEWHNTTIAFVQIDENKERSFCFYRKDTADYYLPDIPDDYIKNATIVHIGSLMISEDYGYNFALDIIKKAKLFNKIISFDVNYRSDIFINEKESLLRYKKIIEKVDIVKMSIEEVSLFTTNYIDSLKNKLICITMGKAGSKWYYNETSNVVPSITVNAIDTTGAGDAFFAGVLSKLYNTTKDNWNPSFLNEVFYFANICGALSTLGYGAIDSLPTLDEINKYYK